MVVDNHGAGGADAHRREPEVGGLQTAGLDGFQGVFEPAKMGIYIVGAEGELDAAVLGPTDDVETGDEVGESHKKTTQAELD